MSDPHPPFAGEARPLSRVIRDVLLDVQELVRAEIRLATAEARHQVTLVSSSVVPLAVGAVALAGAWLFGLWAAVYALALVMPLWAASLAVAVVCAVVGGVSVGIGVRRVKQVRAVPERTIRSVKENLSWISQSSK